MRLRIPDSVPPTLPQESQSALTMHLRATLLTPMYGGGVDAGMVDNDMPIRATSIRGQLRFWWRLRHRNMASQALFKAERAIWGGMSEGKNDHSSRVRVRVIETRSKSYQETPELPAYAAWTLPDDTLLSALLANGSDFDLRVDCATEELLEDVKETLRWWASFGGLGARVRRGFGALRVELKTGEDYQLLAPVTTEEAQAFQCDLRIQNTTKNNAMDAWQKAISALQMFRQGVNVGRNPPSGTSRSPAGRSRWPEADSIREIVARVARQPPNFPHQPEHLAREAFPRAAFGLPIEIRYIDPGEPKAICLLPVVRGQKKDRMGSPLILKPYATENGCACAALRLPTDDFLDMALTLVGDYDGLPTLTREAWWPTDPAPRNEKAKEVPPMANRGPDALTAFMNYFKAQR